jgi:hypothetical protein
MDKARARGGQLRHAAPQEQMGGASEIARRRHLFGIAQKGHRLLARRGPWRLLLGLRPLRRSRGRTSTQTSHSAAATATAIRPFSTQGQLLPKNCAMGRNSACNQRPNASSQGGGGGRCHGAGGVNCRSDAPRKARQRSSAPASAP